MHVGQQLDRRRVQHVAAIERLGGGRVGPACCRRRMIDNQTAFRRAARRTIIVIVIRTLQLISIYARHVRAVLSARCRNRGPPEPKAATLTRPQPVLRAAGRAAY